MTSCICDFEMRLQNKFSYCCEVGMMKNEIASVAVYGSFSLQNPFQKIYREEDVNNG